MPRQMPSIGRAVHYRPYSGAGDTPAPCWAATITEIDQAGDPESPVGLAIMCPTGILFQHHVRYGDAAGAWHWPEYVPPVEE